MTNEELVQQLQEAQARIAQKADRIAELEARIAELEQKLAEAQLRIGSWPVSFARRANTDTTSLT